jgi:hypothetical protein
MKFEPEKLIARVGVSPGLILAYAAILVVCSIFSVKVLLNLDRGIDVSDTGFYYNSILSYSSIGYNITAFGAVWGMLPVPDSVLAHRLALFFFTLASSVYFSSQVFSELPRPARAPALPSVLGIGVGVGLTSTLYATWLPDPSYNAITVILVLFLTGLVLRIGRVFATETRPRAELLWAGFLIVALMFVRPPTALMIGVLGAIYVLSKKSCRREFASVVLYSILGMLLFCLVYSIRVEPVWFGVEKLILGLQAWQAIGFDSALPTRLDTYFSDLSDIIAIHHTELLLGAFSLALMASYRRTEPDRVALLVGVLVLGIVGLELFRNVMVSMTENGDRSARALALSAYLYSIFGAVFIANFINMRDFGKWNNWGEDRYAWLAGFVFLGQFAIRFGSSNSHWTYSTALYPALLYSMVCFLIYAKLHRTSLVLCAFLVIGVVLSAQIPAWSASSQRPYRLDGTLADQVHPVELRGGRSGLRTAERTAALLEAMQIEEPVDWVDGDAPVLIDLSGGMPLMVYHLNLAAPRTPWLIGGFDWSGRFFERILSELDDRTLCRAWVLSAPESRRAIDPAPLERRGVDLGLDYDEVASAYAPYPGTDIALLRPNLNSVLCSRSALSRTE